MLEGKNAVVYGGGGMIGGAVARAFAREGATVYLAGRTAAHPSAGWVAHVGASVWRAHRLTIARCPAARQRPEPRQRPQGA